MKSNFINLLISILVFLSIPEIYAQDNTLQFDGMNDQVTMGSIDLPISNELTVMAWVKWDIAPSAGNKWANMITCNAYNSGDHGRFWFQHNANNHKFEFAIKTTNGRRFMFSSTSPQQGVWYHIAATYDGSQIKLYVNGVLENTKNHTGTIIPHESRFYTTIGGWANSGNNYRRFAGEINNVSIWNVALNEIEINERICTCSPSPTGLVAYWNMDDIVGDTLYDLTGNNFDGIIQGANILINTNESCNTLPIELLYFEPACGQDSVVIIKWATATEINNDYFIIYRSTDGENWEPIDQINASGNSSEVIEYEYRDRALTGKEMTYFYKLQQIDYDGKSETFDIISVYCRKNLKQVKIYPNPISSYANIEFNNVYKSNEPVQITVINSTGTIVSQAVYNDININDRIYLKHELPELNSGTYYIQIKHGNNYVYTTPVLIQQ